MFTTKEKQDSLSRLKMMMKTYFLFFQASFQVIVRNAGKFLGEFNNIIFGRILNDLLLESFILFL